MGLSTCCPLEPLAPLQAKERGAQQRCGAFTSDKNSSSQRLHTCCCCCWQEEELPPLQHSCEGLQRVVQRSGRLTSASFSVDASPPDCTLKVYSVLAEGPANTNMCISTHIHRSLFPIEVRCQQAPPAGFIPCCPRQQIWDTRSSTEIEQLFSYISGHVHHYTDTSNFLSAVARSGQGLAFSAEKSQVTLEHAHASLQM